jgi:hypothetical protein
MSRGRQAGKQADIPYPIRTRPVFHRVFMELEETKVLLSPTMLSCFALYALRSATSETALEAVSMNEWMNG